MSKTSNKEKIQCLKAYLYELNNKKNYSGKSFKSKQPSVVYNPNIKL